MSIQSNPIRVRTFQHHFLLLLGRSKTASRLSAALRHLLATLRAVLLVTWGLASWSWGADDVADWARMKSIHPRSYVCGRATKPIQIDGRLDDSSWKTARWTEDFVDIQGSHQTRPRFRTRAKMLWDDDYFYIGAELEEPHVWGTITQHDEVIFHDPDFEVFIDPNGDAHDYYEFEMNALNTGWDLLLKKPYKDGGPALNEWEIPGLKTAVHVNGTLNVSTDRDRSWSVEIAFPWKSLAPLAGRPAPPAEGDQWRVNFSRVEWRIELQDGQYRKVPGRKEDNWVWSPQGIIDMHRPEKWGYVQFAAQAKNTRYKPDPSIPVRLVLQEIYYAQRAYRKQNNRWAESLDQLAVPVGLGQALFLAPRMQMTPEGYEVTAGLKGPADQVERWHIRQDARVWRE